jgi:hypothetical protein
VRAPVSTCGKLVGPVLRRTESSASTHDAWDGRGTSVARAPNVSAIGRRSLPD